jgi:ABC-type branched-subunit amino acid transport system ATPase component
MVNGEVIASDLPERIRGNEQVQLAYLGDAVA